MDRDKKIYFGKTTSFNELLEMVEAGDLRFYYKGKGYNIIVSGSPCVAFISCDTHDEWLRTKKDYETFEELLLKHVFDDGVHILEAFQSNEIEPD